MKTIVTAHKLSIVMNNGDNGTLGYLSHSVTRGDAVCSQLTRSLLQEYGVGGTYTKIGDI